MYPQSMFLGQNKKNIKIFHLKIIIFTAVKICCILHGRVFVMMYSKEADHQCQHCSESACNINEIMSIVHRIT